MAAEGPEGSPCWCGERRGRVLFPARDLRFGFPGEFEVARCAACGTVRKVPRFVGGGGLAGTLDSLLVKRRRFEPQLVDRAWLVAALTPLEWALNVLQVGEGLEVVAASAPH